MSETKQAETRAGFEKFRDQDPFYAPGYTAETWFNAGWAGAAKEIARQLRDSAKAMRAEYDYSGAEALEDAAKLIEREYEVK